MSQSSATEMESCHGQVNPSPNESEPPGVASERDVSETGSVSPLEKPVVVEWTGDAGRVEQSRESKSREQEVRGDAPSSAVVDPPKPVAVEAPAGGRAPRVIALMNQKGGVGKTTTAVNIGAALAEAGHRVLLIDMDPQAHLSLHVGVDPSRLDHTVYDLLTNDHVSAADIALEVGERLAVLPAEVNLAGAEAELAPRMATGLAQRLLKHKCEAMLDPQAALFDYAIIDCPPSLGLLTINSLTLANEVIVPMQAHFLALQGLSKLLETVTLIRQSFNPSLIVSGVILCMHEKQTLLAQEVMGDLASFLDESRSHDVPWAGAQVFKPAIRRNIKLAECPSFGKTIFDYAPDSNGAEDYRRLAQSIAAAAVREAG